MIFLETIQQLEACCPSPDNKNCSGAFQIKLDMNHNSITHTHTRDAQKSGDASDDAALLAHDSPRQPIFFHFQPTVRLISCFDFGTHLLGGN